MLTINTGYSKPVAKKASSNNYLSTAKNCQEVTIPIHVAGGESSDATDSIYVSSSSTVGGYHSSHGRDYGCHERFKPISCTIKTSNSLNNATSYASSSTCSLSIPSSTRAIATAATLAATKDELPAYRPQYHHHFNEYNNPGAAKRVSYNQTQIASAVSYNNNNFGNSTTTAMAAATSNAANGFYTTSTATTSSSTTGPRLSSLPITTPSTKASKLDISFTIEPAYSASSTSAIHTSNCGTSSTRIRLEYSDNDDEYEHIIDDDDDDYKIY